MTETRLVHALWNRAVHSVADFRATQFSAFMRFLVSVDAVVLEIDSDDKRPIVLSDDIELMPGASFGDVLAEELDIHLPYGSLVLLQPSGFAACPSESAGYMVCQLIIALAKQQAVYPGDAEVLTLVDRLAERADSPRRAPSD